MKILPRIKLYIIVAISILILSIVCNGVINYRIEKAEKRCESEEYEKYRRFAMKRQRALLRRMWELINDVPLDTGTSKKRNKRELLIL